MLRPLEDKVISEMKNVYGLLDMKTVMMGKT